MGKLIKSRSSTAPAASAPLRALVNEALKVEPEWKRLDTLAGRKLSAVAFPAEAIKEAGSTAERVNKLLEVLKSDRANLDNARGSFRRMKSAIKTANWTSPPKEFRRLNYLLDKEGKVIAELASVGSHSLELFAAAAVVAAEESPEVFGEAKSTSAIESRVGELALERDDVFARIPIAVSASDLEFTDFDKDGRARVSLRMTEGAVGLHPIETLGERLVTWALANRHVASGG